MKKPIEQPKALQVFTADRGVFLLMSDGTTYRFVQKHGTSIFSWVPASAAPNPKAKADA